jgi:hypothetical protein
VVLLIPPLGLFANSAGPLGPGGALVRVGRRLPRDIPPQFPNASPDRIEHGATSPEENSQSPSTTAISSVATEKARASGDMWQSQTTVTNLPVERRRTPQRGRDDHPFPQHMVSVVGGDVESASSGTAIANPNARYGAHLQQSNHSVG